MCMTVGAAEVLRVVEQAWAAPAVLTAVSPSRTPTRRSGGPTGGCGFPRIPVFWGVGCTCLLGLALEMWSGPWGLSRASFAIQPRPRLRTLLDGAGPQAPGVTWLVEQNADVEALYF